MSGPRHFPVAPLVQRARATWRQPNGMPGEPSDTMILQHACGIHQATACRATQRGTVTEKAADHAAVALGVHPCSIWPEWWDGVEL